MTRGQVRRRLSVNWWQYLALALVPLFVINGVFGQGEAILPVLAMPLFIAGVASMFVSLKFFGGYKHGLIATQKALDTPEEPAAWIALAAKRRTAFLVAALPAWIGALAVFVGLEAVPLMLLALSTLPFLWNVWRTLRRPAPEVDGVANPWDGHTLEWATTSPAPTYNFEEIPTVASAEPLLDLAAAPGDGGTGTSDGSTT